MGNTRDTGFLRNIIAYDASGNVGIGGAVNASYKLAVTGAATFSGNVGIGGGANERLTVTGPSGLAGMVRWTDATTGSAFLGFTSGGTAYIHSNNNSLAFGANGSNNFAETMRIANGNVGIGTSSPSYKLTVVNAVNGGYPLRLIGGDSNQSEMGFYLHNGGGSLGLNTSGDLSIFTGGSDRMRITSTGKIVVAGTTAGTALNDSITINTSSSTGYSGIICTTAGTQRGYYGATSTGLEIGASSTGNIAFWTLGSERMRIRDDGHILMHNTLFDSSFSGQLFASSGDTYFTRSAGAVLWLNRKTNDGVLLTFQKDGVNTGTISTNSNSLPSDLNFKKNINNLELGLNLITKLRPVSYNHKIDDDDAALSTGFIAQELEHTLEELGVGKNAYYILQNKPDEDKSQSQYWLDYTKMIPVLTKGLQEEDAKVEDLKAEVAQLKEKIAYLENK